MNISKTLLLLATIIGSLLFTSCEKAAEEVLDAMGVNTFKDDDTIFEKASMRNVGGGTFVVEEGTKVQLFIGKASTKKACTYEKASWKSDSPDVASVSPAKGNATIVTVNAIGMALITVSDLEGNLLTVTIEGVEQSTPEDPEEPEYPEDPDNPDDPNGGLFDGTVALFFNYVEDPYVTDQTIQLTTGNSDMLLCLVSTETGQKINDGYEDVTWESSDPSVVYLYPSTGPYTFIRPDGVGTAVITATDRLGNTLQTTVECLLDDPDNGEGDEPEEDLDVFDAGDVLMDFYDNTVISGTVVSEFPGNYIDVFIGDGVSKDPHFMRNITWTSSDTSVASFSNDSGYAIRVDVEGIGISVITATDERGNELSFSVKGVPSGSRQARTRKE